jgi:hypothetical protein
VLETQRLNLIKNWIKILTELVCSLLGVWLELEKPPHEDFYIKNLGILVWLETEPRAIWIHLFSI